MASIFARRGRHKRCLEGCALLASVRYSRTHTYFRLQRLPFGTTLLAVCLTAWLAPLWGAGTPYVVEEVYSPDGLRVAIVTDKVQFDIGEYEMTVREYSDLTDTWGPPRVIGPDGYNWHPRWSPDGSKLTFTSNQTTYLRESDVFVINFDGTGAVNLTSSSPGWNGWPTWSPYGDKIAFLSNRNGAGDNHELWVMSPDGSSQVRIGGWFVPWWTTITWLDANTLSLWQRGVEYTAKADGSGDPYPTNPPPSPEIGPFPSVVLATLVPRQTVLAPLALASVFGQGLSTSTERALEPTLTEDGSISTELLGSCVKIGSLFAPILAVTRNQINFQVPAEAPVGPNQLTVVRDCDTNAPNSSFSATVNIDRASPGFFRYGSNVAARFENGVPVAPVGFVSDEIGRPSRPARPGDIISIYGTGWGPTTASTKTGEVVTEAAALLPEAAPHVTFGGVPLPQENILYIGTAPGAAGLYQLNMVIPPLPRSGDIGIVLRVYGKFSPVGPTVPVDGP